MKSKTTVRPLHTRSRSDRIAGVMLGLATGDALGAPYEFGPPRPDLDPAMVGGGGFRWEKGEWTDDTSMAIVIATSALNGNDLRDEHVQDRIVRGWVKWSHETKDIGSQTSTVLGGMRRPGAAACRAESRAFHVARGKSGGNGSLMRTAPVALRYLDDRIAAAEAARSIGMLTHWDAEAGDACVLWVEAIRHAVLRAEFNLRGGLDLIPQERRGYWERAITEAETHDPAHFNHNGWCVQALQGAWSAISRTNQSGPQHLADALIHAVRGGKDTDTVAAIAGGLLGARWGASAVPLEWRRELHGWPGLVGEDLMRFASLIVSGDDPLAIENRANDHLFQAVRHPYDEGVWLGGKDLLADLPSDVTAVVSLCRIPTDERPKGIESRNHVQVYLLDEPEPEANPHLDFVLTQAADAVAQLRAEGHVVLLHCVSALSRTPTIAALYGYRWFEVTQDEALNDTLDALTRAYPNPGFRAALRRLG